MKSALICLVLVACSASARHKTIVTTYEATDVAAASLITYSHDHEANIVKTATTLDVGKAELAAFREKVDEIVKSIGAVYRAVAIAALADDDRSVAAMLQIAAILSSELHEVGVLK